MVKTLFINHCRGAVTVSASRLPLTAARFKWQMEKGVFTLCEKFLLNGTCGPSLFDFSPLLQNDEYNETLKVNG